jgi:hypothetical protein
MKIEKKKFYFVYIRGYLLELVIKMCRFDKKKSTKPNKFRSFFSLKNSLCRSKSYFSGRNLVKILPKKRNIGVWTQGVLPNLKRTQKYGNLPPQ